MDDLSRVDGIAGPAEVAGRRPTRSEAVMSGRPAGELGDWEADKREAVADTRDTAASGRDVVADARDVVAGVRDAIADSRDVRSREWEQQLEARARRLGLVPAEEASRGAEVAEAAAARSVAEAELTASSTAREEAAGMREEGKQRRLARHRDALLAAAFAGIAEHLSEAESPCDLLTRVAEAAVITITGSSGATVTLDAVDPGPGDHTRVPNQVGSPREDAQMEAALSFHFTVPTGQGGESRTASLNVFGEPAQLDQAAEDIGFILAAHASLAANVVGERVRLERLGGHLQQALLSRDVIGQAKGILMERRKVTSDQAFEILIGVSQRLNLKLREVARTLAETGEIERDHP